MSPSDLDLLVIALLAERGQQDHTTIGSKAVRDAARRRTKREPEFEQTATQTSRERHPCGRAEHADPLDHHEHPIPLVVIERIQPTDDLVMQLDFGHRASIAYQRLSHKSDVEAAPAEGGRLRNGKRARQWHETDLVADSRLRVQFDVGPQPPSSVHVAACRLRRTKEHDCRATEPGSQTIEAHVGTRTACE